ncbi:MAG: RNA polymerase sigma factor, partial [Verrucomicrobiota bacterium]
MRACKGRIAAMASRYVQCAPELDDLCQEIFVHLWRGLQSYRFDAPFPHWVSRVAVKTCLTPLQKRRRRPRRRHRILERSRPRRNHGRRMDRFPGSRRRGGSRGRPHPGYRRPGRR